MIKLRMEKAPSASIVVCSKHFDEQDFVYPVYKSLGYKYRKLSPEAIPSLNLRVRPHDTRRPGKRLRDAGVKGMLLQIHSRCHNLPFPYNWTS
ncbi:uncharacterized protein ISCGN_023148 [Ixodes scapularis]